MLLTDRPLRFVVQMAIDDGEWRLRVKNGTYSYNLEVKDETLSAHASSRGVNDPRTLATIGAMV